MIELPLGVVQPLVFVVNDRPVAVWVTTTLDEGVVPPYEKLENVTFPATIVFPVPSRESRLTALAGAAARRAAPTAARPRIRDLECIVTPQ